VILAMVKQNKNRVIVLLGCKPDGSEKLPPLVTVQTPVLQKYKKTPHQIPING
jgi:hypothetical protein